METSNKPVRRDARIVELCVQKRSTLVTWARALGWSPDMIALRGTTNDELIAIILDAETRRGIVTP